MYMGSGGSTGESFPLIDATTSIVIWTQFVHFAILIDVTSRSRCRCTLSWLWTTDKCKFLPRTANIYEIESKSWLFSTSAAFYQFGPAINCKENLMLPVLRQIFSRNLPINQNFTKNTERVFDNCILGRFQDNRKHSATVNPSVILHCRKYNDITTWILMNILINTYDLLWIINIQWLYISSRTTINS